MLTGGHRRSSTLRHQDTKTKAAWNLDHNVLSGFVPLSLLINKVCSTTSPRSYKNEETGTYRSHSLDY